MNRRERKGRKEEERIGRRVNTPMFILPFAPSAHFVVHYQYLTEGDFITSKFPVGAFRGIAPLRHHQRCGDPLPG